MGISMTLGNGKNWIPESKPYAPEHNRCFLRYKILASTSEIEST